MGERFRPNIFKFRPRITWSRVVTCGALVELGLGIASLYNGARGDSIAYNEARRLNLAEGDHARYALARKAEMNTEKWFQSGFAFTSVGTFVLVAEVGYNISNRQKIKPVAKPRLKIAA